MIFWRVAPNGVTDNGVTAMVKARPRSRRPGIQGAGDPASGPRLRFGVTQAPEDGKANRAVHAEALGCPQSMARKSMARIAAGVAYREKTLAVSGDTARLMEKLRSL